MYYESKFKKLQEFVVAEISQLKQYSERKRKPFNG